MASNNNNAPPAPDELTSDTPIPGKQLTAQQQADGAQLIRNMVGALQGHSDQLKRLEAFHELSEKDAELVGKELKQFNGRLDWMMKRIEILEGQFEKFKNKVK
jgi:hypothetical protein